MRSPKRYLLTDLLYFKLWVALAIGIFSSEYIENITLSFLVPLFVLILLQSSHYLLKIKRSKWADNAIFSSVVLFGVVLHLFSEYRAEIALKSISPFLNEEAYHHVRIENKPIEKKNSYQIEGRLLQSSINNTPQSFYQKIYIYIPKSKIKNDFDYGSILQFKGKVTEPSKPHYDFEFDYHQFLKRKQIYITLYSKQIVNIGKDNSLLFQLGKFPYRVRDYFENEIDRYIKEPSANDIAKSILIGVKTDIDRPLYQAYSDTGAIHILSISGLHFGILILFLEFLLSFVIKNETYRFYLKHSISFSYALITGFNAPIFRSFLMFLFLDLSKISRAKTSSFNILFLSAFIILLYDSNQLFDLGYQFSYAALLGIMLMYNKIIWKIEFNHFTFNFMWKSAVTLFAAWLFTAPLSIYYFHKISLLGSLSNFIVVPFTTGIMYVGFIFMICSKIPFLGDLLGQLLSYLVSAQNYLIIWFSKIPLAQISSIYSNKIILLTSIFSILFFNLFLRLKDKVSFRFFIFSFALMLSFSSFFPYQAKKKDEWFLMGSYQHTGIIYSNHNKVFILADSIEERQKEFFIQSLLAHRSADSILYYPLHITMTYQRMKYSTQLNSTPIYYLLCRENESEWNTAIQSRDSFILMPNLGYQKNNLIQLLGQNKRHYLVH